MPSQATNRGPAPQKNIRMVFHDRKITFRGLLVLFSVAWDTPEQTATDRGIRTHLSTAASNSLTTLANTGKLPTNKLQAAKFFGATITKQREK